MRRQAAVLGALCVGVLGLPGVAGAATTPAAGRGILTLPLADTLERGRVAMGLFVTGLLEGKDGSVVGGPMGAALGFHERAELTLSTATTAPEDVERAVRGVDPVQVGLKWRPLDEGALRPGLAGGLGLRYVRGGFDLLPRLTVQKTYAPFVAVLSLGAALALGEGAEDRLGVDGGAGAQGTFGAWRVLVEVTGRLAAARAWGPSALHVRAGTTYEVGDGLQLLAMASGGLGPDATDLRLVFGVIFTTGDERGLDHDHDGVADLDDRCLFVPEDRDGIDDDDGCPDADTYQVAQEAPPERGFTTPTPRFRMRVRSTWVRPLAPTEAASAGDTREPGATAAGAEEAAP